MLLATLACVVRSPVVEPLSSEGGRLWWGWNDECWLRTIGGPRLHTVNDGQQAFAGSGSFGGSVMGARSPCILLAVVICGLK